MNLETQYLIISEDERKVVHILILLRELVTVDSEILCEQLDSMYCDLVERQADCLINMVKDSVD